MSTVTTPATGLPWGRPLLADDLEHLPDDGHRYELIDGVLIVSPGARPVHQAVSASLYRLLHAACPPDLLVLYAPLDVRLANDTVMQPDLLVTRRGDLGDRNLPVAPVLALEILSPSTRSFDLLVKKERFARAGCPHYWVVDPMVPSVTAWRLEERDYILVGEAQRAEVIALDSPFPVEVRPDDLVDL